jgi:hypothetical protein
MITPTNTSSMTRTEQTEHIEDKAEAITMAEVFEEVSETVVTSEAVTVSGEVVAVTDMSYYLHNRRSVTSATNRVAGQQNTLLKNGSKRTTSSANTPPVFIRNPQPYTTRAF